MKQKVFITGISSEILLSLLDLIDLTNYEIYGLTRNPHDVMVDKRVILVEGDINDLNTFQDHLRDCSIIIHAAAVTHSFNEKKYFEINLEATRRLIDVANQTDGKHFVFISSNTAGEHSGAYGITKFLAEKYIEKNCLNWLILRPAEIYGTKKEEGIDKFIKGAVIKTFVLYPGGVPTKFYPVALEDVAEIIYSVVFDEKLTNERITICGPKGYSFTELLQLIKKYKGKPVLSTPVPKYIMFFLEKLTRKIPYSMGFIPDQIPRLYTRKNYGTTLFRKGKKRFESYLKEKILAKNK